MRFLVKALGYLIVIGVIALVGFAIFSELPAPERDIVIPIEPR